MYLGAIFCVYFIIVVIAVIVHLCRITSMIKKSANQTMNAVQNALDMESMATPRSVGGATELFLSQIQKDFPNFHYSEIKSGMNVFIAEYLDIIYRQNSRFEESNVDDRLLTNIQLENIYAKPTYIYLNGMSITGYNKSFDYATVTFNVSVGYNIGNQRYEKLYSVEYTFKIMDGDMFSETLICSHCGGALGNTAMTTCPYCDTRIIRDTIMSWKFSSIVEKR